MARLNREPTVPGATPSVSATSSMGMSSMQRSTRTARCSTESVSEAPFELVTVEDRAVLVRGARGSEGLRREVRDPGPLALRLVIADPNEQAVRPALEPRWVTQATDVPPDIEDGPLRGILGQVAITQDAVGHAIQARMAHDHERLQRPLIAVRRLFDEVSVHAVLLVAGRVDLSLVTVRGQRKGFLSRFVCVVAATLPDRG